jgi:hypothetical protein
VPRLSVLSFPILYQALTDYLISSMLASENSASLASLLGGKLCPVVKGGSQKTNAGGQS